MEEELGVEYVMQYIGMQKANNKFMKNYNKNSESSYLMYLDSNNMYGWALFQKLPAYGFKQKKSVSKFDEEFIKNYDEHSNKGYILEVDVEYPNDLHNFHSELSFLSKRMKLNVISLYAICMIKKNVVHIRALKQALHHGLILKKYFSISV